MTRSQRSRLIETLIDCWIALPVVGLLWIYSVAIGPFIDHGVDLFRHMTDIQDALHHQKVSGGHLLDETKNIGTYNHLIHNLSAMVAFYLNMSGLELIPRLSFFYSAVWTISILSFSQYFFWATGFRGKTLYFLALTSVLLYWATFGINSFSFPRYYFASPVILTYCGYLSLLSITNFVLLNGRVSGSLTVIFAVILLVITYLHPQELLLYLAMALTLSAIVLARKLFNSRRLYGLTQSALVSTLAVGMLLLSAIALIIIILFVDREIEVTTRVLDIGSWIPLIESVYVLDPTFQFYTVFGLWGCVVYLIAIANWKILAEHPLLMAVIYLPLLTVFNPAFVEVFLRVQNSLTLWRVLYAIPLPVLATFLIYRLCRFTKAQSSGVKILSGAQAAIMVIALVPAVADTFGSGISRWPSLQRTPSANSYLHWIDLIRYLDSIDQRKDILVDPSTGYAISALTKHKTYTKKFYDVKHGIRINYDAYDEKTFRKKKGWLLVINQRNGALNTKLREPYHVPPDVMLVKQNYSMELVEFVEKNTEVLFRKLWQSEEGDIAVYEVL